MSRAFSQTRKLECVCPEEMPEAIRETLVNLQGTASNTENVMAQTSNRTSGPTRLCNYSTFWVDPSVLFRRHHVMSAVAQEFRALEQREVGGDHLSA